ncbi:hypothetical protein KUCAC02_000469 [Chaenocephalus aceratus]|uniref:Uncharacterized protein n=1 Tax=Chaenocephalus aceratus TaxID=36190 RepID=A0ACB9W5M3_CHAAC|nr:hypothetical protein KUCAC02_000469 [Chaenocephalus aceratus]
MKCEHGRDVFEVTPTPPSSHHHHYHLHSTTPQLPLPPTSLYPIWPAPPRSFGRGVVESSVAFLANDAPLPTHAHTHIHTHIFLRTHTLSSSETNCCSNRWAPLAAPHWGESPTDTFLFPHATRRWLTGWKTEAPHILRSRHSP